MLPSNSGAAGCCFSYRSMNLSSPIRSAQAASGSKPSIEIRHVIDNAAPNLDESRPTALDAVLFKGALCRSAVGGRLDGIHTACFIFMRVHALCLSGSAAAGRALQVRQS